MKPDSQNARLLAVLRGGPATNFEIHKLAGHMVVNSRVSELRALGYDIRCEHRGGVGAGAFVYTLLSEGSTEGGAGQAQRWSGTGWSQVAEAPVEETDSGLIAGERKVVGDPSPSSVLTIGESPSSSTASDKPPEVPQTAVPAALTHSVAGLQLDLFGAAA